MYYVSLPKLENVNESVDCQSQQVLETPLERAATAIAQKPTVDEENRNEPQYDDLLATVSDLNGNKRKRYDSASSASSLATKQNEPEEVSLSFLFRFAKTGMVSFFLTDCFAFLFRIM